MSSITKPQSQALSDAPDLLLSAILDMGELLLTSGAEVLRVEDTLKRLCTAYGFSQINVFCITSSIVLTVQGEHAKVYTQTRRIASRDTNLQRIALVNALSRQLCREVLPVSLLQEKIAEIRHSKVCPIAVQCICYAVISAAFSVFFGGTFLDGLAAVFSGLLLFGTQFFVQKLRMNSILQSLLVSAFTAFVVLLLVHLGIGNTPEKIMIGNIMLLIPGIAFTTSLRDLINGDTISGLIGLIEAIVKAIAIAIGFAAVLVQFGGAL